MAERYDAAIIGAGADGLAAAALLARAGLKTIVVERLPRPGGMLATREFHPGFFAAPFADVLAPIDDRLFWSLDLARHGALAAPPVPPAAIAPEGLVRARPSPALAAEIAARRTAALAAAAHVPPLPSRFNVFARPQRASWPQERWSHRALADVLAGEPEGALLAAAALEGRAADPFAPGSALHLLAAADGAQWHGGLGRLGSALVAAAREAGAELACGLDVSDIRCRKNRVAGIGHADGSELAARAVISTLDVKRTFLSLFAWNTLTKPAVNRIAHFRLAGSTARLLIALAERPALPRGALHLAPDLAGFVAAHAAWQSSIVAERLPLVLRHVSAADPALAPAGGAVVTVTIGGVPHLPFDGAWTHDKRERLMRTILAQIEDVVPGKSVAAAELLVPPDMEDALSATAGDLWGGEIAPDQMFGYRPGFEQDAPRTPVAGLYLGGPSAPAGPLGTCAAGAIAAHALLADLRAGHLP